MSSGQVLKAEKDFSKDVDKLLPEAEELGKVWQVVSHLVLC
jgi:26S proteasome regulatory subunit N5